MTGSDTGPQIQVSADEDWKSRVKAEDAARDAQFRKTDASADAGKTASSARPEERKTETPVEFPDATFEALLGMLSTQAMVALGLLPNPATRKVEKQLPLARYFIDLIAVLEKKTAGNLAGEEAAALDEALHSLRMTFVQRSKETV